MLPTPTPRIARGGPTTAARVCAIGAVGVAAWQPVSRPGRLLVFDSCGSSLAFRPRPRVLQVDICDQLCAYLSKWTDEASEPSTSAPAAAAPAPAASNGRALPEGVVLKGKKDDRDDDLERMCGGIGKGKKAGKKAEPVAAPKPRAAERLTHAIDALASFGKIGLMPPHTVVRAPPASQRAAPGPHQLFFSPCAPPFSARALASVLPPPGPALFARPLSPPGSTLTRPLAPSLLASFPSCRRATWPRQRRPCPPRRSATSSSGRLR